MNRRDFLALLMATGARFTLPDGVCNAAQKQKKMPNILIIITDDQGYADLSAFSHSANDIATPNMDRIAKEGVLYTQAYVSAPVCSPSRSGWNTGLYQQRWDPSASWGPGLPRKVKTIAERLRDAGYATGKVGKSDFGKGYHSMDVREYPLNHGFDEFLGFSSHAHDFFLLSEDVEKRTPDPHGHSAALGTLFHNRSRKSFDKGYTTEIFTDTAIDFVKRHKDKPFFLTVSYNSVHHLIHEVPERYLEKYNVKKIPNYDPGTMGKYETYYKKYCRLGAITDKNMRQYYLANLNCLDDNIGRLLDTVDNLNLAEDTLLFFFADNGGSPLTGADNRPLRGSKYILFEGGIRVPFMMRWPNRLPKGRTYEHRISTLDILPTCLNAAGLTVPSVGELDGESFLEAVRNDLPSSTHSRALFWRFGKNWAVREGDWKLVKTKDFDSPKPTSLILRGPLAPDRAMLFNLKKDPAEQNDVYEQYPQVAKRLNKLFLEWKNQVKNSRR